MISPALDLDGCSVPSQRMAVVGGEVEAKVIPCTTLEMEKEIKKFN